MPVAVAMAMAMAMAMANHGNGHGHRNGDHAWAIDSIRASTRDLVSGYPGKTDLPGQSRIWAYPGIWANWRETCLPLDLGRRKLSRLNLAYPSIHRVPGTLSNV